MPISAFPINTIAPTANIIGSSPSGVVTGTDVQTAINQLAAAIGTGSGFDIINVMDYGAVGDNTADDSDAIQAAIDFMMQQGGNHRIRTIYLPEGNYRITKPIYFDHPANLRGLTAAVWNSGFTYTQNEVAVSGGTRFISIQNNNLNHLTSDTAWWIPFNWDVSRAYTVGQKVLFNNIPWKCMVANTGRQPVLPPKAGGEAYNLGQRTEYRNRHYVAQANGVSSNGVFWENRPLNPAQWVEEPIYWLPDSVWPNIFYMSPIITGVGDDSGQNNWGTTIRPTFNTCPILHITPGQGPEVHNLQLICPQSPSAFGNYGGMPPNGIGIALHGGNGGSSRMLVSGCAVWNCYYGLVTGTVEDALNDSNTIYRCQFWNCAVGVIFSKTQNFINAVIECSMGAMVSVEAAVGTGCHVYGGNFSPNGAVSSKLALSGISTFTYTGSSAGQWDFTATIVPDVNLVAGRYSGTTGGCTLKTAHFGVIPVTIMSFNETTNVAALRIAQPWTGGFLNGGHTDPRGNCDIEAEVQACTFIYCCERATIFLGEGFHVIGTHIEAATTPLCLILADSGFGSGPKSVLELLQFNSDVSMSAYTVADDGFSAPRFYAAMAYPYINVRTRDVEIRNSMLGVFGFPVPIWAWDSGTRLTMHNNKYAQFQFLMNALSWQDAQGGSVWHQIFGGGEGDGPPYRAAQVAMNNFSGQKRLGGIATAPHWGVRPAGYTVPTMPGDVVGTYRMNAQVPDGDGGIRLPMMWGGHPYQIHGEVTVPQWDTNTFVRSNHFFYTYGYDLTSAIIPGLSWSYKGASFCVYVADAANDMRHMFPGLGIILNGKLYMVTGTYEGLGYFTVAQFIAPDGAGVLDGDKNTIFTGSLIGQQLYDIRVLPEKYTYLPPPCDAVTPAICYGFRKLRTAYAGPCIRIRRSSDNVEADIGFDPSGDLDAFAFQAHVGASTAFVRTWYDQSVNASHLQQTTNANQPVCILNGFNQRPVIKCVNASAQKMTATVTGPATTATAVTVEAVGQMDQLLLGPFNYFYGSYVGASGVCQIGGDSFANGPFIGFSGAGNIGIRAKAFNSPMHLAAYQDATVSSAAVNGVPMPTTKPGAAPAFNNIRLGAIDAEFNGRVMEIIVIPQNLSLRDKAIWQNQMTYFAI